MELSCKVVDYVYHRIIEAGLVTKDTVDGCSDDDINQLEQQFNVQLPAAYHYFLKVMGRGAGTFLEGTDWRYPQLVRMQKEAERLVGQSTTSYRLPQDVFVFAMNQGYSFLFFEAGQDDPPVFRFTEYDKEPMKVVPTFGEWLANCADEQITYERQQLP